MIKENINHVVVKNKLFIIYKLLLNKYKKNKLIFINLH